MTYRTRQRIALSDWVLLAVLSAVGLVFARLVVIILVTMMPPCAEGLAGFAAVPNPLGTPLTMLSGLLYVAVASAVYALTLLVTGVIERAGAVALLFRGTAAALLAAAAYVLFLLTPGHVPPPVETVTLSVVPERIAYADLPREVRATLSGELTDGSGDLAFVEVSIFQYRSEPGSVLQTQEACYDPQRGLLILEEPRMILRAVGRNEVDVVRFYSAPAQKPRPSLAPRRGAWWEALRAAQTYEPLTAEEIAAMNRARGRPSPLGG